MSGRLDDYCLEMREVSLDYKAASRTGFDRGQHHVLKNVSFGVRQGETLGLIGRNGSGKSTALRLLAGIIGPTEGEILVRGGLSVSILGLGIGFRPQLSGRDNAFLSSILQGKSQQQASNLLAEIAEFCDIGDSFNEPVKTYSQGMKARLAFSTALVTEVDILLIDEVLSVGDAAFREKAEAALKNRIAGEQTVVYVSHSGQQIRSICDRLIWLDNGEVSAEGDVAEVLRKYTKAIKG